VQPRSETKNDLGCTARTSSHTLRSAHGKRRDYAWVVRGNHTSQ
jgi:hypothetical protein